MSLFSWLRIPTSKRASRGRTQQRPTPRFRPKLEALEDRTLLSNYTAATVSDLIADINAANKAGGTNTITLTAPTTSPYVLTAVDNTTNGANGLPVISKKDNLTILGGGDTIERSTASGTPGFRLFDVAIGGSLTLQNLTLQNGFAVDGGAISNQGYLTLQGVTVENNIALGSDGNLTTVAKSLSAATGGDAAGGGIWSDGTLFLEDLTLPSGTVLHTTLQNNRALGGSGGDFKNKNTGALEAADGGQALGGALYLAGGTTGSTNATLTNVSFLNNVALGGFGGDNFGGIGNGGNGGAAFGGAVDIAEAGTVVTNGITLENNDASGGKGGDAIGPALGGTGGDGSGGAVYVTGGLTAGTVSMDGMFFQGNIAQGGPGGYSSEPDDTEALTGLGGNAYGGAVFVGGGSAYGMVFIYGSIVQGNEAVGGLGVPGGGGGAGGGLYIATGASVTLDAFSVTYIVNNTDSNTGLNGSTANIDGSYALDTGF